MFLSSFLLLQGSGALRQPVSCTSFFVTVQSLTVTSKNPFQIGFADGIFAFKPVFYYGQRSKCADLLNSYLYSFYLFYFLYLRDLSLFSLTEKSGPGHSQILSQIRLPISVVPTCFMPSSMISTVR